MATYPRPPQGVQPLDLSLFRARQGVLHIELGREHQQPIGDCDLGLWITSQRSGITASWAWHHWADTLDPRGKRLVYVYGPSTQTCALLPQLAGWRAHVHVTG